MDRQTRTILILIVVPFISLVLVCGGLYFGAIKVMGRAANTGWIGSNVVGHTIDGHRCVLPPGTALHFEGDAILDGHHVLKIKILDGPLKGLTVLVPNGSITLGGRNASP